MPLQCATFAKGDRAELDQGCLRKDSLNRTVRWRINPPDQFLLLLTVGKTDTAKATMQGSALSSRTASFFIAGDKLKS